MHSISVVIPLSPVESDYDSLVESLVSNVHITEVILSSTTLSNTLSSEADWHPKVRLVDSTTTPGRAAQLNIGASHASGDFLWFIHADSRISKESISRMATSITAKSEALYYCDLCFRGDGPTLVFLNQFGAWLRSHLLGLPFGDQGLAISQESFRVLKGYDEGASIGEDHLFVWKAKRARIPIIASGGVIETSARKYARDGWLRVTAHNLAVTYSQIWSEWWKKPYRS